MKKIIILLAFGLFLTVTSCSKEDDNSDTIVTINKNTNKQATGSSANDLLSEKKFNNAIIEVVYVQGYEPTPAAINNLVSFIQARMYKSAGVNVIKRAIASPGTAPYTIEEIVAIEDANRTKYNAGSQIAVWAFFADGQASTDTSTAVTLGTAYRNTSFVIYENTVQTLSDSPFEPNRTILETTVMTHEFGHILGLTNLGTPLQSSHEDTAHPKHCNVQSCLMYWSSESGKGLTNMVSAGAAPQLDAQCIADLRANGGK